MGILQNTKRAANRLLSAVNIRIESLTAERAETTRLSGMQASGHFERPLFPVLPQFEACDPSQIFRQIRSDGPRFGKIARGSYPLKNNYYTTPDAEALYAVVRLHEPERIVEIGSGFSTQLFRVAIGDARTNTKLTSIDPDPRQDINRYSDVIVRQRVEKLADLTAFQELDEKDILFVDSSHEIKPGNDLLHIVFNILPKLRPGVLIHFHDIFLPYEYPKEWICDNRWNWTEQYLVQALLTGNDSYDAIWPGYYLQRTRPDFASYFSNWSNSTARSLWLRKIRS